ncbi:putative bifunctional diguanylate cyclase/phosphodiesterase [Catellatospora tritici]|uniref:putative bifunctional diguanylate cyclase/phosphodiesterase n=1 Tax=Catellatospora tritici TaxID=2851566 RepID=UPI001C2CD52E|nr:bifunctional diguanylate cyclase/phosphodiesterase [Catellatospora tritici]MBV1849830.1 bifunctional diguanylate cyclase/phosphodiesterase [Catellatospora tritici]
MILLTLGLVALLQLSSADRPLTVPAGLVLPLALLFVVLFVVADVSQLSFEVRRHAFLLTPMEIPFLLALYFLPPVTVVLTRLVAVVLTRVAAPIVMSRRPVVLVKAAFNIALVCLSSAVGCTVVVALGPLEATEASTWLALVAAVMTTVFVSLVGVLGVITLVQGRLPGKDMSVPLPGIAVALVNTMIGLVVLLVLQQSLWAMLLLFGLLSCFIVAYRSYARSQRQHQTLTEIYDLTRAMSDTPHDGTLPDALLGRVQRLLQAEYATLWLPAQGRHPEVLLSARADDKGLLDVAGAPASMRKRAVEAGATVAAGARIGDDQLRSELREAAVKDAIVVPLRAGSAVIGTLEVAGRLGDVAHFGEADVRLLETIAAHAAVAVENNRLVDRLRFDAYHDALTALPNRRRVSQALEEAVRVRAPGEVVALLMFDVDGLRDVNDSLGHAAGDQLLAEVATRIRTLAPPAALVGRTGGDEFVVTLRLPNADAAVDLAAELRVQLQDPMTFGSLTLDVDTAVGISLHPEHGSDPATLLQRADVATHAAKGLAGGVQLFDPGLESRSMRRLGLAGDLRRALDNDELEVFFQPKVSLRDRRLVGVECLARWEHPTHGAVAPEDFVAVAEHTGQLSRLTDVVLREGLRRARQWVDAGRPLSVAVNLSPRTLVDPSFPQRVDDLLQEFGVSPDRLTLEITEDGVVDGVDRLLPTLRRLYDLGVHLSVDDFGTGYSSLSYLRRLPVHEVKVDRSFVQGMATDPGDLAIVRAVVDISRHFGLNVVAEGVESELTLELLEEIGCDIGQGFLFSRPLPYERLEAWLGAQTDAEPTPLGEVRRLRAVG